MYGQRRLRLDERQCLERDVDVVERYVELVCDNLGNKEDVAGYTVSRKIRLHWLPDGDHGFKPRKKSGRTEQQNWDEALDAFIGFTESL